MTPEELQKFKGRSLPSDKFGAWIVDQISASLDGRSRLVSADLTREQWMWTSNLVEIFKMYDDDPNQP